MKALAVVGSCWGDEGKGAAVDKLAAANPDSLVVRFNGGGQAGHTIVTPDGRRHIFSHFCSGALAGAPGHLSEYFVVNPRIFAIEFEELKALKANLSLSVDPKALVTTPLDVVINRALETKRGAGRHGSVGIGFGETIERSERGFPLYAEDLFEPTILREKIKRIVYEWGDIRGKELDIIRGDIINGHYSVEEFLRVCTKFAYYVRLMPLQNVVDEGFSTIIFEGAQGLLLDQKRGMTFPHVTRSNTGLQNVIPLANQLNIKELSTIYMMRSYLTRHGVGPLPGEVNELKGIEVIDKTNTTKPWQGHLRFAPMDAELVRNAIAEDLLDANKHKEHPHITPYLGISCVDQVKSSHIFNIMKNIKYTVGIIGRGPSRDKYSLRRELRDQGHIQWVGSSMEV